MNGATRIAEPVRSIAGLPIVLAGLSLGVAGDLLLWETEAMGPGFALWVLLLGVLVVAVNHREPKAWQRHLLIFSGIAFAAALVLVFRAAPLFLPLMATVLISCSVLVVLQAGGIRWGMASAGDLVRAFLQLPLRVLSGGWPFLQQLDLRGFGLNPRGQGILRGALLSLPLLAIFVALFSSADATFERYASAMGDLLARDLPRHVLVVSVISWLAMGLLGCTIRRPAQAVPQRTPRQLGIEETAVILGSLALLFLSFVMVQVGYLFGGQAVIEQTSGLTLAQYARRGFFELMVVSGLAMGVLHGVSSRQAGQAGNGLFKWLALGLVGLVMCIVISAAQRLILYMSEFGLTLPRLLASACMGWIVCNLAIFSSRVVRKREAGLASGYLLSGMAILLILAMVNPAGLVASGNLQHAVTRSSEPDVNYLLQLGPDAVPTILDNLDKLPRIARCALAQGLMSRYPAATETPDWRSWNASRGAAIHAVREHGALERACR